MGGTTCEVDKNVPCNACNWNSKALMITFLLNNDQFSKIDAENWEKFVF